MISRGPLPEGPPPPSEAFQYVQEAFKPRWGRRSHWKEPWRSYLETVPAKQVLDGIGINVNSKQKQVPYVMEALGRLGFKRVRIEPGWNSLSYSDPTKFTTTASAMFTAQIQGCKENGLRPLILLNANHGDPCPSLSVTTLKLLENAPVGATSIKIDPAGLPQIVKGKTGITANGVKCYYLFKSYAEDGTVQLSQPLKAELKAGTISNCATLKYEPFHPISDVTGTVPNPKAEETILGWLNYAAVVTQKCKELLGSEEFDVEVWNELSFGSNFLGINNYYKPSLEEGSANGLSALWGRTLAFLRDPANGVSNIGVNNGFVNQGNGVTGGPGATANSRHPYPGRQDYPAFDTTSPIFQSGSGAEDASGVVAMKTNSKGEREPIFVPTYRAWLPELPLLNLQTECKVLDIGPYQFYIPDRPTGEPHGRYSVAAKQPWPKDTNGGLLPSGYEKSVTGEVPVELWITETNIGSWGNALANLTAADKLHLETKVILRSIIAYLTKGLKAIYFYAAGDGTNSDLFMFAKGFFEAIGAVSAYPGDEAAGEVINSVGRLAAALKGAAPIAKPGNLLLEDLGDYAGNVQFKGALEPIINPETGEPFSFPDKTNKDCFFFAPMQVDDSRRFVISAYVMTRDVAHEYGGTGPARFDLPEEKYRMTIGGVKGTGAIVSALDPITGVSVPVTTIESGASKLVVEMKVTDYPRLLTIQESN